MPSTAEFLIGRLENCGLKHIFGLPGDFVFDFFSKSLNSKKIELVTNTDEAGAAFAADGYARASGVGCVAVTYAVGALKILNTIAGAKSESSPIIAIGGAPGVKERSNNPPLHHTIIGDLDFQREFFKKLTCAQAYLDNPITAAYEIDRVFEALKYYRQPVYIELPRDTSKLQVNYDVYNQGTPKAFVGDLQNLEDAVKEVARLISEAKNPVILAGVEVGRCKVGRELTKFAEKHNIPIACTLLSKSVINEMHPLYIGVYAGSNSSLNHVKEMVENSDCLLVCGEVLTEATAGYRSSKVFQKIDMITCTISNLKIRNHHYPNVSFVDFCKALFKTELTPKIKPVLPPKAEISKFVPSPNKLLTIARLFEKINAVLDEDTVIVADTGDALLGSTDLTVHSHGSFYGPAFYLSMGFAIPAALGVKLAKPEVKPIILVGDGAFQMSASELSTILKCKLAPLVIVINNRGYTTERMILDGKFNDIVDWNYHLYPQMMGGGKGFKVTNEQELETAITDWEKSKQLTVLNCVIDAFDVSAALKRFTQSLSKKVKEKGD